MSLDRLRSFIEVYRQRSITGAARTLGLTQPTVSNHIAGLETTLGRPLFQRRADGVVPTSVADELASDIGNTLDLAETALASAKARSQDMSGALQIIGHADFLAEVLSPRLVPLLREGIRVRLHMGDGPMVIQRLLDGDCDLGISAHPLTDKRLKSDVLYSAQTVAVAAPSVVERLQRSKNVPAALLNEPLLAYNLDLPLIDDWLQNNHISAPHSPPAVAGQDLRAQRLLLCQGFGWSVLPDFLCAPFIRSGELCALPPPVGNGQMTYYLIWQPSALREPRTAHARQSLLWQMGKGSHDIATVP